MLYWLTLRLYNVSRYQTLHTRYNFAFPQGPDPVTSVLSFEKGKGYRDKPDHSTNSAIGRVVGLVPITLPLFTQVFFNTRYIGGLEDCLYELRKWDRQTRYATLVEKYQAEIASGFDPDNARLALPDHNERVVEEPAKARKCKAVLEMPDGSTTIAIRKVVEVLLQHIPLESLVYQPSGATFANSASGDTVVESLQSAWGISPTEAVDWAEHLTEQGLLYHVDSHNFPPHLRSSFQHTPKDLYRLCCHADPWTLNSYLPLWPSSGSILSQNLNNSFVFTDSAASVSSRGSGSTAASPNVSLLDTIHNLHRLVAVMELSSLDPETGRLNTRHAITLTNFVKLEETACELQAVSKESLFLLSENEMTAFCLNLYSILIRLAHLKVGTPATEADRLHLLQHVKFQLAEETYTLQEWVDILTYRTEFKVHLNHHGSYSRSNSNLLPINPHHNNSFSVAGSLYSEHDDSSSESLSVKRDKRLLLALFVGPHGGSRWSLPFARYTAQQLDQELEITARVFCQDNAHVLVNRAEHAVELVSSVFVTYRSEFAGTTTKKPSDMNTSLLETIHSYLHGKKRSDLSAMLQQQQHYQQQSLSSSSSRSSSDKIRIVYRDPNEGIGGRHVVPGSPIYQAATLVQTRRRSGNAALTSSPTSKKSPVAVKGGGALVGSLLRRMDSKRRKQQQQAQKGRNELDAAAPRQRSSSQWQ